MEEEAEAEADEEEEVASETPSKIPYDMISFLIDVASRPGPDTHSEATALNFCWLTNSATCNAT